MARRLAWAIKPRRQPIRSAWMGGPVKEAEKLIYVALYKPRGVISTVSDPDLRPAVRDLVPVPGTLYRWGGSISILKVWS